MVSFEVHRIGVLTVLAYVVAFFLVWQRAERLRAERHPTPHLPSWLSFATGTAFVWIWTGGHREIGDRRLSRLVVAVRVLLASAMLLIALGLLLRES